MEYAVVLFILLTMATCANRPTSGHGWKYQPVRNGMQAYESTEDEDMHLDSRYIGHTWLLSTTSVFHDPDLVSFVQLEVDEDRNQLLVGGRDVLFRLDLDQLTELERAEWKSNDSTRLTCQNKGISEGQCHNFMRVLLLINSSNEVLACGTNAFEPNCTWRNVSDLAQVTNVTDGLGMCPFDPNDNTTALVASDGSFYGGTAINFMSSDDAIIRKLSNVTLRTKQQDHGWLFDPNFVSAYEIDNFVYFFFRETAFEHSNCGENVISRVARVCMSDQGGKFALEHTWTSYLKTRLTCSLPGKFPFYFDELRGTFYEQNDQLIYALFTTPENSIPGSAVCVYNMTAIADPFDGPFKHRNDPTAIWLMEDNNFAHTGCRNQSYNISESSEYNNLHHVRRKYQLMNQAVLSREIGPLVMAENERWTHIVVDHVTTKRGVVDVLFLATKNGKLRKMMRLPGTDTTCLIEEIDIAPRGGPRPVTNMRLSSAKGAIYISMEGDILKVPVQRCHRFRHTSQCFKARDPYCGWNHRTVTCSPAPGGNTKMTYWAQIVNSCPVLDLQIAGKWSPWSEWSHCTERINNTLVSWCFCRSRACDRPRPSNNGYPCPGVLAEIKNCTVDGAWTEWSAWSGCSKTCGPGVRQRSRQCGNPAPQFGGSPCPGNGTKQGDCPDNLPCPAVYVHGNWSAWSTWSDCSSECNSGVQTRRRTCIDPGSIETAVICLDSGYQWRTCDDQIFPVDSSWSDWSDWSTCSTTCGPGERERSRFCHNRVLPWGGPPYISISRVRESYCPHNSPCPVDGAWSEWSGWSDCSTTCGPGVRVKLRHCNNPAPEYGGLPCPGSNIEQLNDCQGVPDCIIDRVYGVWLPWSDWSTCTQECNSGVQRRGRECHYLQTSTDPCPGYGHEYKPCNEQTCD